MKKIKTNYDIFREKALSDPKSKLYYDSLQPERETIMAIIDARNKLGLTQQDIANKTGIDRADISKIENGVVNPTVKTLQKLAKAMNSKLVISFIPIKNNQNNAK